MSDFMESDEAGEIRRQQSYIVSLQDRLRSVERDRQQFADLLNDVAIALDDVLGITNRIGRTPAERVKYLADQLRGERLEHHQIHTSCHAERGGERAAGILAAIETVKSYGRGYVHTAADAGMVASVKEQIINRLTALLDDHSDCADCGKPTIKPIYWAGTSARCPDCHDKRMQGEGK